LYTAADFELDERHVIKNEKVALDRLRVRQNVFLVSQPILFALSTRQQHFLAADIMTKITVQISGDILPYNTAHLKKFILLLLLFLWTALLWKV